MQKILPVNLEARDNYQLLTSIIIPRPIAFVSTVNKNGLPNAAPFCFFTPITPLPPTVAFSVMRRGDQKKDTLRNIEISRDFVINIVNENLSQPMNIASGSYPPDMSEFDVAGLTPLPSEFVSAPRIAESPIHLECRLTNILELGQVPASLVIGEVVCFHINETLLLDGKIDLKKIRTIGRIQDNTYLRLTDLFELVRPG